MSAPSVPFRVADRVAAILATSPVVADAAGAPPRVYLHAVDPDDPADPIILVTAGREMLPVRGDRAFQVVVGIACRPADHTAGNPAAAEARPDGVLLCGADALRVDAIARAALSAVLSGAPGAIPTGCEVETDTLDPSAHTALVTIDFAEVSDLGLDFGQETF